MKPADQDPHSFHSSCKCTLIIGILKLDKNWVGVLFVEADYNLRVAFRKTMFIGGTKEVG